MRLGQLFVDNSDMMEILQEHTTTAKTQKLTLKLPKSLTWHVNVASRPTEAVTLKVYSKFDFIVFLLYCAHSKTYFSIGAANFGSVEKKQRSLKCY